MGNIILEYKHNWQGQDLSAKLDSAKTLFHEWVDVLLGEQEVLLSTEFIRLSYLIQNLNFSRTTAFYLFKCHAELKRYSADSKKYAHKPQLAEFVRHVFNFFEQVFLKREMTAITMPEVFNGSKGRKSGQNYYGHLRLILIRKIDESLYEAVFDEDHGHIVECLLQHDRDILGLSMHEVVNEWMDFPMTIHAHQINVVDDVLIPEYYVVEPDYLIDVTAIAGSFQPQGQFAMSNVFYRLIPSPPSKYLIIGNIVNYFLDELIARREVSFKGLFKQTFKFFPLALTILDESEVREIYETCKRHFKNLQRSLATEFPSAQILLEDSTLEPTFISNKYGLQGRLDVLHEGSNKASIIELKSGKPYRANQYGIKIDHYVQTLMYDLLIRSAGIDQNPKNFILYSTLDSQNLKYAPAIKALQIEALNVRNDIVVMEAMMRHASTEGLQKILNQILSGNMPNASSFHHRDANSLLNHINSSHPLARKYYLDHVAFVLREMRISKLGKVGSNGRSGLSGIWLNSIREKEEEFDVLSHLQYHSLHLDEGHKLLKFVKTEKTNHLANFRVGDVSLLYPYNAGDQSALRNQVFKCTLIDLNEEYVVVRLRSKQFKESHFRNEDHWNIEHDVLDSSFNGSFDNLHYFLQIKKERQELLLGLKPPQSTKVEIDADFSISSALLDAQKEVFTKIVQAKDYYLLWGPPGTGKTSVMLKELVKYYHDCTDYNIFLLGYTNRSVDEICATLKSSAGDYKDHFVRIGSRYSSAPEFKEHLLVQKLDDISNRDELRRFLEGIRVFTATLASFLGKRSILDFKKKNLLIVDEASQILEPGLIGLLGHFDKFVLIGDHRQLPAVSTQDDLTGKSKDEALIEAGLGNLSQSFFERLYKQCTNNKWEHAVGLLRYQGRMHKTIANFVNQYFYGGQLSCIPGIDRLHTTKIPSYALAQGRMIFIPSKANPFSPMAKTNEHEAQIVTSIVVDLLSKAKEEGYELTHDHLGIITPFRAQIAMIKKNLSNKKIARNSAITIDTVERFQGGARNIIIISVCANLPSQLKAISSISEDGVDRKLNVALTRAKEQVIVIGDPELLKKSKQYSNYIDSANAISMS